YGSMGVWGIRTGLVVLVVVLVVLVLESPDRGGRRRGRRGRGFRSGPDPPYSITPILPYSVQNSSRWSPRPRVTRWASRYSGGGRAYLRVEPMRSRNWEAVIVFCSAR